MSIYKFIGLIGALAVFFGSVAMTLKSLNFIFELHSLLLVVGGTIAVAIIAFPLEQIVTLMRVFFRRLLGKSRIDYLGLIRDVVALTQARRQGARAFESAIDKVGNPFLKDAAGMLTWMSGEVSEEEFKDLLQTRAETHHRQYHNEAKIFRTMAKFPPAFGLLGTTLGMIALLQSLGEPDAIKDIGPAMSVALVATLYGIAISNFLFVPMAENLSRQTEDDHLMRAIVIEGVMLMQADKPTIYIEEKLRSFLLPRQRGAGSTRSSKGEAA